MPYMYRRRYRDSHAIWVISYIWLRTPLYKTLIIYFIKYPYKISYWVCCFAQASPAASPAVTGAQGGTPPPPHPAAEGTQAQAAAAEALAAAEPRPPAARGEPDGGIEQKVQVTDVKVKTFEDTLAILTQQLESFRLKSISNTYIIYFVVLDHFLTILLSEFSYNWLKIIESHPLQIYKKIYWPRM